MAETILISRTDSIGDMVLTLPLAGLLKEKKPGCRVLFLGRSYTRPVAEACEYVDAFYDWDEVSGKGILHQSEFLRQTGADILIHVFPRKEIAVAAMKTGIPVRIGSTGRLWHWWTCNRLVALSRKNSEWHEAQLNTVLLKPLGIEGMLTLKDLYPYAALNRIPPLDEHWRSLVRPDRINLIFHPLSLGSAREWGLDHFIALAEMLPGERFQVFVTGTRQEGLEIRGSGIFSFTHVYDLTGRFSLSELIAFIHQCDGLVAASTGPLHLAGVLEKFALGLYPPIRPMHPGRWAPLGPDSQVISLGIQCNRCRHSKECECMRKISPRQVADKILEHYQTSAAGHEPDHPD